LKEERKFLEMQGNTFNQPFVSMISVVDGLLRLYKAGPAFVSGRKHKTSEGRSNFNFSSLTVDLKA
jgi:hypothetical protein